MEVAPTARVLRLLRGAAGTFEDAVPGAKAVLALSASANVVPDRISGRAWTNPGPPAPNRVLKPDPPGGGRGAGPGRGRRRGGWHFWGRGSRRQGRTCSFRVRKCGARPD